MNLLLDPTPEVIKEAKEFVQRECVAHICRTAALTALRFKKAPLGQVSVLLRYSALLVSMPAASAELHWQRMTTHLM
jgi:hypothetical protein